MITIQSGSSDFWSSKSENRHLNSIRFGHLKKILKKMPTAVVTFMYVSPTKSIYWNPNSAGEAGLWEVTRS
jgi:hypothetical protein